MAGRKGGALLVFADSALTLASSAAGEQLPLKLYTTAGGLASDRIRCILADSHGFLWLGTADGISRFDGYGFTNLTSRDGLPGTDVHAIVEAGDGSYWAATNTGIFHWDPAGIQPIGHRPEVLHAGPGPADDVRSLLEDRREPGSFWAATHEGLYRARKEAGAWRFTREPVEPADASGVSRLNALCQDRSGNLWIGSEEGLFRRDPSGAAARVSASDGSPHDARSLLCRNDGSVWIGSHAEGLFQIVPGAGGGPMPRLLLSRATGLAGEFVVTLFETADHEIWAGCFGGLTKITADGRVARTYTTREGLSTNGVWSLAEDRDGDLWIGSENAGLMRLAPNGFRRYDARDGMASTGIDAIFENRDGEPCVFTRGVRPEQIVVDESFIECFDGRRFRSARPRVQPGTSFGWGTSQIVFQDVAGEWWVPTIGGLYRFPAVPFSELERTSPRRIYTEKDGLPSNVLYRLFEDSRADLWIGFAAGPRRLALWNRVSDSFRAFTPDDGIPANEEPTSFAEDRDGSVWIGFPSGLARWRGAKMRLFRQTDGLPRGGVEAVLVDHLGRVWLACDAGGVARIDAPQLERPRFVSYGPADGLASGNTFSLIEDRFGRIYIGTSRSLDRLDPAGRLVQHFTTDDGLARGDVEDSFRDRRGTLWFGSAQGLSRLDPVAEPVKRPPAVRIARVLADGARQALPELGAIRARLPELASSSGPIQIDFLAIDFAPGGRPRYQYRLQSVDKDWSPATDQRSVIYSRLPAGHYRFLVRGIANDGAVGDAPAEVLFTILPPFWKRPDVLALAAIVVAVSAFGFHRYRLRSALAVERVRTRVAADLHDDIGAGLSEIAILSELARREQKTAAPAQTLLEIGAGARRLVDSMSDIVWSTDPSKDDVSSLAQRIRRFAGNILESQGIRWSLELTGEIETRRLDPDTRRQVFLVVKEALTNVARHSGCRRAVVRVAVTSDQLAVEIEDDGRGFDPSAQVSGHGLANLRARTRSLGGSFEAASNSGDGTRVLVRVPLRRRIGSA